MPAFLISGATLYCGRASTVVSRHVAKSDAPVWTACHFCPLSLRDPPATWRHCSPPQYLSSEHFEIAGERPPSIVPRGGISACGARRCHLAIGPDLHAMCQHPAPPQRITPTQIEFAGMRMSSIYATWHNLGSSAPAAAKSASSALLSQNLALIEPLTSSLTGVEMGARPATRPRPFLKSLCLKDTCFPPTRVFEYMKKPPRRQCGINSCSYFPFVYARV